MPDHPPERVPPLPPIAEANRAFAGAFTVVLAGLAGLFVALPSERSWLLQEGGLTEGLTAATLAAATIVGIWAMRRTPSAPRCYWLVPAAAAVGILDETGFGAGLFGYDRIQVDDVTVDGIGDLLAVIEQVATTTFGLRPLDLAAGAVAVAAVGAIFLARHRRASRVLAWLHEHPPCALLTAAATAGALAAVLDLTAGLDAVAFTGEMLELVGAGFLVRGSLLIAQPSPSLEGWRPRMSAWMPDRAAPLARSGDHHPES